MTSARFTAGMRAATLKVEAITAIEHLPCKRDVVVKYRDTTFATSVSSTGEEISVRFQSMLRSVASETKVIRQLWGEELLVTRDSRVPYKFDIEEGLMDKCDCARQQLENAMVEKQVSNCDGISSVLTSKVKDLILIDPFFAIEEHLLLMLVNGGSDTRLAKGLDECLPKDDIHMPPETCAQHLNALLVSPLFKFSARADQQRLTMVVNMVSAIVEGNAPDITVALRDEQMAAVVAKFQWFIIAPTIPKKQRTPEQPQVIGIPAFAVLGTRAKAKLDASTVTLADTRSLKIFTHFIPEDYRDTAASIISEVDAKCGDQVNVMARRQPAKREAKGAGSASARSQGDTAVTTAMNMFTG